jgi:hypothetical protein
MASSEYTPRQKEIDSPFSEATDRAVLPGQLTMPRLKQAKQCWDTTGTYLRLRSAG